MDIKQVYQKRLEQVAIRNYVEQRENELQGKRFSWCDPKNEAIEIGLKELLALYQEMKAKGEL